MGSALEMIRAVGDCLAEIPIREASAASSRTAAQSYRRLASLLPPGIPTIIESVMSPDALEEELATAHFALGDTPADSAQPPQLLSNP